MGNCVRKDFSDNQWGGDSEYWESLPSSSEKSIFSGKPSRKSLKRDEDSGDRFSSSNGRKSTKEVKIKITKKQLEELLGMKDMQGLTLEQVLTRLMKDGDEVFKSNQRSWRPTLHSIPE